MRIIAVVGLSNSGKTLLISRLIAEFTRRGLRTSAVKHCAHGFSLDRKGKDTWKFARAGADGLAMVAPDEFLVLQKARGAGLRETAVTSFPQADIVLVEGGKRTPGMKKIEVLRSGVPVAPVSPPGELLAVVSDGELACKIRAPLFSTGQTAEICDLILSQEEEAMPEIQLEIDGRNVPLNSFVRSFIEKTVVGMVTSLSGVDQNPKKIILMIDRGEPAPAGPRGRKI